MSAPEIESARQQWRAASRRLEELRGDARLYHRLVAQVGAVVDELRRRVGGAFTLEELVRAYHGSERWLLAVLEAADPEPGWERHSALVADAGFHAYSSGAIDYAP